MSVFEQCESPWPSGAGEPDPEVCRNARLARDARFDGVFFLGVRTTGIYCRPVCPARAPAEKNVRYFASAALAAQAGFRPCLRCRPESAPGSPAWRGSSTSVQRALDLIAQGALNTGSLAELAQRLGLGERYLRKLFQRELGISPLALALNQRLLFAKKLLAETSLPVTDIAFAAGFGSLRRFNSAVRQQFGLTPGALRGRRGVTETGAALTLSLHYRPPYDWEGVADFLQRHAITGLESADHTGYRRPVAIGGATGHIAVRPLPGRHALRLDVELSDQRLLMPLVARVRRVFDLDANPATIRQVLGQDRRLAPLVQRFPGIRCPGHWSPFEAAVRAIVGQQISTQAARGVLERLARGAGGSAQTPRFPDAAAIAALADAHFAMPGRRRATLRALCEISRGREDDLDPGNLAELAGVGPWTVAMAAMRGGGQPDVFPTRDLGLEKAWAALPGRAADLTTRAPHWRPWRGYAANLLWRSLNP